MDNLVLFRIYKMNVPHRIDEECNPLEEGACCFHKELSMWCTADDWYLAIYLYEDSEATVKDIIEEAYLTLKATDYMGKEELVFMNDEII